MSLPKELDERVRRRFDQLIKEGFELLISIKDKPDAIKYSSFITKVKNLTRFILDTSQYHQYLNEIQELEKKNRATMSAHLIYGILKGLKDDYESGMLDDLSQMIEANLTYDYMIQAEQLLGGKHHEYDHVPAAVLAGAVLEDALRRLCQRQEQPIPTEKSNGDRKTLDPLITDLQKRRKFNKAKADQIRSWAKIRNAAAHGNFDEFDRTQVDEMIPGIKKFLADYL